MLNKETFERLAEKYGVDISDMTSFTESEKLERLLDAVSGGGNGGGCECSTGTVYVMMDYDANEYGGESKRLFFWDLDKGNITDPVDDVQGLIDTVGIGNIMIGDTYSGQLSFYSIFAFSDASEGGMKGYDFSYLRGKWKNGDYVLDPQGIMVDNEGWSISPE